MLPTQAIKLVESYCPYLTLTTGSRFDKRKDSYKEKALTSSLDLTFLPLPFVAHSHRKENEDQKSSLLQCLVHQLVIFKARHPRRGTRALIFINAMT